MRPGRAMSRHFKANVFLVFYFESQVLSLQSVVITLGNF